MEPPEPYPDLSQPTAVQCLAMRDELLALHGFPKEFERYRRQAMTVAELPPSSGESILDGLVFNADTRSVENAIRCGGLAATKAARIKSILKDVREKRGKICLEYLRGLSVVEVKAELSQFKGVGPKTNKVAGEESLKLRSPKSLSSHVSSETTEAIDRYSASADECAMTNYFLLLQHFSLYPKFYGRVAKAEWSTLDISFSGDETTNRHRRRGVDDAAGLSTNRYRRRGR
ncbi:hypothetical protein KSP39_PZI013508 [Platanthera zijinensis]|uniref:Uncharacterized protein n=1 Tax=Platanthera zijinensis TaxID=2320716 RepID=A0AAP0G3B2_9ASPA